MGQHTIPQRSQSNFQDPGRPGFIWLHDRKNGPPARSAPIKAVLQSKGFYSPETERELAEKIEKPGNNAIAKLISDRPIDARERLDVSHYTGTMLMRVPAFRRWVEPLVPAALTESIARGRQLIRQAKADGRWDPGLIDKRFSEFDAMEQQYSAEIPQWALAKAHNPFPSDLIVDALFHMTWRIMTTTGPQFFALSDNPAFFSFRHGIGLRDPDCQFSLPLSTTHALNGSWRHADRQTVWVKVRQATVREVNKCIISQTDRVALYHKPADWIFTLFANPEPRLNLLGW
jgi:hypothetical protein